MSDDIQGKTIIITGAGGGFGKLVAEKVGALGANVVCADVNLVTAQAVAQSIIEAGGSALAVAADVTQPEQIRAIAEQAVARFSSIDVMVNNAGTMPLAFLADHEAALGAWLRAVDINFKGVINGCAAVHDQMMAQGRGHIVNISSIYGNAPVAGAAVYGATKAAINYFSEALRIEGRGKIKVTVIKPTGVPTTGLSASVINPAAAMGIAGQNAGLFLNLIQELQAGNAAALAMDPADIAYESLSPDYIADAVVHAINQPWGVSISDMTVRASGDHFVV